MAILGSYHFDVNLRDPVVGGRENKELRKAISQAIDRDEINEAVYEGIRTVSNGITPPGIPGFGADLCDDCVYDPEAAQEHFDTWQAEGNELTEPLRIQYNIGAGHENVVAIIIDNLAAIGIEAVEEGIDTETYFTQIAEGACQICRTGWFADYPTYDNFMYDLYHTDSLGGNNHGYSNPEFDELVDEAKQTTDPERAGRAVPGGRDDPARRRRDHPVQLVPGRLRLQRGQDRRLHADQLRPHRVGEGVRQELAHKVPDRQGPDHGWPGA